MGIAFERIVIVMLENSTRANVLANPYMRALRSKGVFLANALGVTHSSQPNYILSIGGDTFGIVDDTPGYVQWIYSNPVDAPPVSSIVDLLEAQGLTWKAYAEDLSPENKPLTTSPPDSPPPADKFPFARKHVPFLSYPSITSNPDRLARIVNAQQFEIDLANGTLPAYSWYTPNLINDGHSLSEKEGRHDPTDQDRHVNIDNIARFLHRFLGDDPIAKFPPETLICITFDEAYPYHDSYAIYSLLIGDMLPAGTVRLEPYNHYSQLASVELNFGLGSLWRNDASARPWWFLAS
jgi:acid phosphatase